MRSRTLARLVFAMVSGAGVASPPASACAVEGTPQQGQQSVTDALANTESESRVRSALSSGETDAAPTLLIWRGPIGPVPARAFVDRVAPIVWFSRDEPLLLMGETIPGPLPCDPVEADGPIVYYRVYQNDTKSFTDTIQASAKARLTISFYFYYSQDIGIGCHSNDLERADFEIAFSGTEPTKPGGSVDAVLTSVEGAAHGSRFYANHLSLKGAEPADGVSLPIVLLVEEGKHAMSPDRNGDGSYTPGYDTNRTLNDAWGVRDSFGAGFLGGAAYQSWMTKRRWPDDRLRPDVRNSDTAPSSYRAPWPWPERRYSIRAMPEKCRRPPIQMNEPKPLPSCHKLALRDLLSENDIPETTSLAHLKRNVLKFISTIRVTSEDHTYSMAAVFPLIEEHIGGGVIGVFDTLRLVERGPITHRIFGPGGGDVGAFYEPSMSRFVDWYVRGGFGFGGVSYGKNPTRYKLPQGGMAAAGVEFRLTSVVIAVGGVKRSEGYTALQVEVGLSPLRWIR